MGRKKKLLLNTVSGISLQITTVICGFILPRYTLAYFGSSVNGLVNSITKFLSLITLLDMGVGAVIQSALYKPLAKKDNEQISKIIKSAKKFFRRLAYIFIGYIAVLCFVFPTVINSEYEPWFSASLLVIIAISNLAQYLFGITNELLLNADQKTYIQTSLQICTIMLNTVLAVVLMKNGASIHTVKLASASVFVLRPLFQSIYVSKKYKLNKSIEITEEPIKQKWNGFAQHMATVVYEYADIAALTMFSTLKNVSVYSVYNLVVFGVRMLIMTAINGLESLFGNMFANKETKKLNRAFNTFEFAIHTVVTIVFTTAGLALVPFILIYTKNVTDTNYENCMLATIMCLAYACGCLKLPYNTIIKAAGHFKQTQNGAFIAAGLTVVTTVICVLKFGLAGAAVGTLVGMFFHTCYFVWYLRKNILKRSAKFFVKYCILDILCAAASVFATKKLVTFSNSNYLSWGFCALKTSLIVTAATALISLIFNGKQIKELVRPAKTN